jgi:hypothetical protein
MPAVLVWATTVAAVLSASVRVSVPPVFCAASVSVRAFASLVRLATSLVPVIVTVTVALPPSVVVTVKRRSPPGQRRADRGRWWWRKSTRRRR